MKDLIERALKNIERMSKEQFDQRLEAAKTSQIALALKDLEELSEWCASSIRVSFSLEQLVVSMGLSDVTYSDVEACLVVMAANDERFALAA